MPANLKVIFEIATKGLDGISRVSGQIDKFGKDTEKALKRSATSFKTLATFTGGVIAFETVRRTVTKSIQEYAKHEESVARMTNVLGYESKALLDLAEARMKNTKYSHDETQEAIASMGILIKNEERLKILVPLVQDFASAKGIDLVQAGNLVSKTLQSETNALSRQGISVKGAAGSTERFTSLVNTLTAAVGGNAEAVGQTASGQIAIFKNNIDDLYESLGMALMPTLVDLTKIFKTQFLPVIEDALGLLQGLNKVGEKDVNTQQALTLALIKQKQEWEGIKRFQEGLRDEGDAGFSPSTLAKAETVLGRIREKMIGNKPTIKTNTGKSSIVGSKSTKEKDTLPANILIGLEEMRDRYGDDMLKIIEDSDKITAEAQNKNATARLESIEEERRTESEINRRYDEAQLLQIQDNGQYQLEIMRSQHLAELQSLTLTEDQKTKLIKAHRLEEYYFERQINQQRVQDNLNATVQVIGAMSYAADAIVQINKDQKEKMKPIQRAFAIMEFAAGTAAAITSAWNTAKSNYYLGIALTAEALIQNGAMLATQLQAINTARTGADYVTNGRQMLIVGDNPGGRERVQVTPLSSPNMKGPVNNDNSVGSVNIYVNDQLTGERLIKAIRSGAMRSGLSDLKRALANA